MKNAQKKYIFRCEVKATYFRKINSLKGLIRIKKNKVVPRTGIEPAPTNVDMALNHARLPIPPPGL